MLYVFFNGEVMKSDEVFQVYCTLHAKRNLGLLQARAAAMSTLSGSISALSSTLVGDIINLIGVK
jgi:hypothetical protein